MNNYWKTIDEGKANKICNNAFKSPSYSINKIWWEQKRKDKKWIIKNEFQHNGLTYTSYCTGFEECIKNIMDLSIDLLDGINNKLQYWGYKNIDCRTHTTDVREDGTVETIAIWSDPYNNIYYCLLVNHQREINPHVIAIVESMKDNSPRKISYKRSMFFVMLGIVFLIFGVGSIYLKKIGVFDYYIFGISIIYLIVIGSVSFSCGIYKCINIKIENKYLSELPYKFDIEYELKIHKKIGKSNSHYNKSKTNLKQCEKSFINYTEWKTYINNKYQERINNTSNENNFYHYLFREYRFYKDYADTIKTVAIPLFIAVIPTLTNTNNSIIMGIVLLLVVTYLSTKEIVYAESRKNMINDIISILFQKEEIE